MKLGYEAGHLIFTVVLPAGIVANGLLVVHPDPVVRVFNWWLLKTGHKVSEQMSVEGFRGLGSRSNALLFVLIPIMMLAFLWGWRGW